MHCLRTSLLSLSLIPLLTAHADDNVPRFTVGDAQVIPVVGKKTWFVNDSTFPFLPDKAGTGSIAFWGDAIVMRYTGPDIEHLTPPPDSACVTVTDTPGKDGSWHRNGGWMLTATRTADGTLVGFVHGEDHKFADGKYGEWNSTGVWTSGDDGVTWTNQGEVVGSKKPEIGKFGGMALNECLWDAARKRWLGYSGPYAFLSSDPHAMPGTWFGYHDGTFSQPVDVNEPMPPLTPAPGLEKAGVTWGGLTYNSYLKQFIMTWDKGKSVKAVFSSDGVHWGPVTTLFQETLPNAMDDDISYSFIIGDTDTLSGQDCYLVYMFHPPGITVSKNRKDMVRRPVHFDLGLPRT
jgi:hypothetical protein